MSYGTPVRQTKFRGLDLRRKESRNDGSALAFLNVDIRQVGSFSKRKGIIRIVDRVFPGAVNAIIPTRHCYTIEEFLFGIQGLPNNELNQLIAGPLPRGCGQPRPVKDLAIEEDDDNTRLRLTWKMPGVGCVSGVRIMRKIDEDPLGVDDADALRVFDGPVQTRKIGGVNTPFFDDSNIQENIRYHYGVFTFFIF